MAENIGPFSFVLLIATRQFVGIGVGFFFYPELRVGPTKYQHQFVAKLGLSTVSGIYI